MKKILSVIMIAMMAMSMLALTSCGPTLSLNIDDEKNATIDCKRADAGDFAMAGALVVEEGEQVTITPDLKSGALSIEFISDEGMDSEEEVPDVSGEATYTASVSGTSAQAVNFGSGSFMLKVTATEKAKGTVKISVGSTGA